MPRTRLGTAVRAPRRCARTWSIVRPTRISPWSVLTQAPESMLAMRPRCGLLCRAACSLNRPLRKTMSSRKGSIGFRPGPISIEAPSPLRPPVGRLHAVGEVDAGEPHGRRGRVLRRGELARVLGPHGQRLQPGQGQGQPPAAAEEAPPAHRPRRPPAPIGRSSRPPPTRPRPGATAHCDRWFRNCSLVTIRTTRSAKRPPRARPSVIRSINGRSETISARPRA